MNQTRTCFSKSKDNYKKGKNKKDQGLPEY